MDGVVRHITKVDVVLGGVVLAQGHRFGGVVLRGVRVLGLFGVGEFAVLDDRDGVSAVGQLIEGVASVGIGRRGGDDLTVLVEELDDDAGVSGFCAVLVAVARVVAVDGARQGVVVHVAEVDVRRGRVVVVQRDGLRGVVLRGVRVTGLLEASDGAILNDRDGVGACGELIEGVCAVRIRHGRGHNGAVRVAQLNGHALVELLVRVQRAGAVAVAVDRALDEVVGHVAEVDVLLGRVGLVQGDRLGRVVQRRVGVARLLGVGQGTVLDDLHGVGAVGQLVEGVHAVRVSLRRRDNGSILIEQLHGLLGVAGLAGVQSTGAVVVAVDGAGD